MPKIEHLTHPKPYIVPKPVLFQNLLLVSALFAQGETLYRAENSVFFRNLLLVSALFVQVETLVFRGTWSGCASA